MKKILFSFFVMALAGNLMAQVNENHCGTDEVYQQMIQNDPTILQRSQLFEAQALAKSQEINRKTGTVRIIPVVFHIFHKAGQENISDAQIQNELDLLNLNFRRNGPKSTQTRSIFQGVVADMEIELRLARKDPNGNCTNGIVRVFDEETENGTNNIKLKSVWPTDRYLNVWVVEDIVNFSTGLPGIAGYAQFPWAGSYATDGVIIKSDQIGEIGTSNPGNGTTVTHEIGHWLGLLHTFQDSCTGGDKVEDTPPCADNRDGILSCDYSRNTCSNDNPDLPDQIENYMDYTIGTCQNMFTIGQKARVDASMENWRPNLWKQSNLVATGTDVPNAPANCAPVADFYTVDDQRSLSQFACAGGAAVSFRDNSHNYAGSITRQWIFEGGTPSTSTVANPTVTYADSGKYDVTLIVNNANGYDTIVKKDFIEVIPQQAPQTAPYVQDFEFPVFPTDGWFTNSTTFTDYRVADVGVGTVLPNNSRALVANNGSQISGARFDLYSPSFDLTNAPDAKLSYFYSFALRSTSNGISNDLFRVYYSTNCGQSWSVMPLSTSSGVNLSTVGSTPTSQFVPFVPSDKSKWRQVALNMPNLNASQRKNIRFRFQFISNGGNNFYIDAINIGFTAGIEDKFYESESNFNVYPNPTAGNANVSVNLLKDSEVKVTVLDMMGREVAVLADGKYNQGEQEFEFNPTTHNAANGLYLIKLSVNGRDYTKKLIYND